jgi:dynein heavy chain
MKKPPAGVKLTMQATCIMFMIKPVMKNDPDNVGKKVKDYWEAAQKSILTDANKLLANLKTYDKDNIADTVIEEIEPFMTMAEFTPEVWRGGGGSSAA